MMNSEKSGGERMEDISRIACFTGHRPRRDGLLFAPGEARTERLAERAEDAIRLLCAQHGVRVFLCGMAMGFDLFAAQRLLDLKRRGEIPEEVALIAVLPYPQHAWDLKQERWRRTHREVLQCAQDQFVVSSQRGMDAFRRRNAFLVAHAMYVVAYWSHDIHSGTGQTVRMAQQQDRVLLNLYDL